MEHRPEDGTFRVSAFYKFIPVPDPAELKQQLESFLESRSVLGTILVAREGVNGTVSGPEQEVEALLHFLASCLGIETLPFKVAEAPFRPFHRMKVRLKREIVTLGVEGVDPSRKVGTYVKPDEWNDLIRQQDVVLVDTRNDYEYAVGTFEGALNPKTQSFREFPKYVKEHLDPDKTPKVAMFCTGGIRCEKATSFLLEKGFKEVYHLEGGILEYLHQVPASESLWKGECFVFDERVTVNHDLEPGSYSMCHACRMPLSPDDLRSPHYAEGLSCPYCHDKITSEKRERLSQRNLQMKLARERNERHLGARHKRHDQVKKATAEETALPLNRSCST